jgi:hypothetical protein
VRASGPGPGSGEISAPLDPEGSRGQKETASLDYLPQVTIPSFTVQHCEPCFLSRILSRRLAAEAGPQTDTAHFADWETHSRGIASKLLARMGSVKGSGLGVGGEGRGRERDVRLRGTGREE